MTHRQKIIAYCKDYLEQRNIAEIYNEAQFDQYYKSSNTSLKNAYSAALEAADFIMTGGTMPTTKTVKKFSLTANYIDLTIPTLTIHSSKNAFEVCGEIHELEGNNFQEFFYVLFLNQANKVTGYYLASIGGVTGTIADPRLIIKAAALADCCAVILCHNHPSGSTKPSTADIDLTKKLKEAARCFDIKVLDHIIYAETGYCSLADEGII